MESVMVNYDGTVRNSVGQLIQLRYGEDGLCGETVEFQSLPTVKLANKTFEKRFRFDATNERHLRRVFNEEILRELMGSGEVISALEKEWEQLQRDREALRQIFPSGENKVGEKAEIFPVRPCTHCTGRAFFVHAEISPCESFFGRIWLIFLIHLIFILFILLGTCLQENSDEDMLDVA